MLSTQATRNQYRAQQRIQKDLLAELRKIWRRMGGDWDTSWLRIAPDVVGAVSSAQVEMATATVAFTTSFLAQVDLADEPVADVRPSSMAGYSSDGYPLDGLMYGSVVTARSAGAEQGLNAPQALREGGKWMGLVASSQIADIGRTTTSLELASRPNLNGYTRFLNPPSCSRCAVLAGRVYRYSTGFRRHPKCDCLMVPAASTGWAKAEGFVSDPTADLSLIKDLTRAQTAALEAGADFNQVINASRGMKTVGEGARKRRITTEGTSSRGVYGKSAGQLQKLAGNRYRTTTQARLTPEQIFRQARDRDELVAYLKKYAYLT